MEFDVGQLQRLLIRGLTGDGQASEVEVVEGWRCAEMHINASRRLRGHALKTWSS